jgi:uncharacterized protein (DUF1501 family)
MKRRLFLRTGSAATLPVFLNGFNIGLLPQFSFMNFLNTDSDRILVLVQLDGGNDGLNMLIPLDQYSRLSAVRGDLLIPETSVLKLYDHVGLHPRMTGLKNLFDDGKLAAIQGVSYPDQNRSHFRSTDIWSSGSAADEFLTTGWLGRFFDGRVDGYPQGFPNAEYPDPFAITIRAQVSETCQGLTANYSMAVQDPFNAYPVDETTVAGLPDTNFGHEMAFLIDALRQTNAYSDTIVGAAEQGNNLSTLYDDQNTLAQQLKTVALLISGGLKTKVFVVRIGGFDTHANQVQAGGPGVGSHANLLGQLSDAIYAFQDDLQKLGLEKQVVGMTFSEFGRQIKANDSLGTDHGTAAPLFVFGSCVQGGIIGENPVINQQLQPQEGVAMQHDFRSVYASLLREWFDASDLEAQELLSVDFPALNLIEGCDSTTGIEDAYETHSEHTKVYPNPIASNGFVDFRSHGDWVRISLYDALGRKTGVIAERYFEQGDHSVPFDLRKYPKGSYHVRLEARTWQTAKTVVRQ